MRSVVIPLFLAVCFLMDPPVDDHQPGHLSAAVRSVSALQRHPRQKGLCGDPDP